MNGSIFFSVLAWSPAFLLLEQSGKIQSVVVSHRPGDMADRQFCIFQQTAGPADPVIQKIFLRGGSCDIFKKPVQIGAFNTQIVGNDLDIYCVGVIVFDIPKGLLHIRNLFFLGRNIFSGKFAGQEIQVFIKNTVHHQIPVFRKLSVLFGITEPALFGVNLRYRYPIIGGCLGGAIGGVVVYFTDLAALGFGTTVVPGIALADPANNGYVNYIIAHLIALASGFVFAVLIGMIFDKKKAAADTVSAQGTFQPEKETFAVPAQEKEASAEKAELPEEIYAFASGEFVGIEKVNDPTFAEKVLGDGVAILPTEGKIYAPADCTVEMVMDTKHAVGLRTKAGNGLLIHVGIDTVQLGGKYFDVHVTEGQNLKAGDCIMDFDMPKIAAEGYDTAACLIFTEPLEGTHVDRESERTVSAGDKIAVITE